MDCTDMSTNLRMSPLNKERPIGSGNVKCSTIPQAKSQASSLKPSMRSKCADESYTSINYLKNNVAPTFLNF